MTNEITLSVDPKVQRRIASVAKRMGISVGEYLTSIGEKIVSSTLRDYSEKRDESINFLTSLSTKDFLVSHAEELGISLSSLCNMIVSDYIESEQRNATPQD